MLLLAESAFQNSWRCWNHGGGEHSRTSTIINSSLSFTQREAKWLKLLRILIFGMDINSVKSKSIFLSDFENEIVVFNQKTLLYKWFWSKMTISTRNPLLLYCYLANGKCEWPLPSIIQIRVQPPLIFGEKLPHLMIIKLFKQKDERKWTNRPGKIFMNHEKIWKIRKK